MEVKGLDELERQLMALGEKSGDEGIAECRARSAKGRRGRYEAACRL